MAQTEDWISPPAPDEGDEYLNVDFRVGASLIAQVNTAEETAYVKLHAAFYWTDKRLIGYKDSVLPEKLWGPWIVVRNGSASEFVYDEREFVLVDSDTGRLKRFVVYEGTVHSSMDSLGDFPFDADTICTEFACTGNWRCWDGTMSGSVAKGRGFNLREVRRPEEGSIIGIYWSGHISEWKLYGACFLTHDQHDKSGHITKHIELKFKVCRRAWYYFIKVLLPLFLLVFMFAGTFIFPVDDLASRQDNTMTGFLAAFALIYVVSEHLPKTSKLTPVDQAIMLSLVSMVLCAVENWTVYLFALHDDLARAERINTIFGITLGVFYVLLIMLLLARPAYRRHLMKLQWRQEAAGSKRLLAQRNPNSPPISEYHMSFNPSEL
eukprot:m.31154 g.31154  ORF g.31154 m.31154 type:complete len:379 (-) comp8287_c0_seq2:128-1264(-)